MMHGDGGESGDDIMGVMGGDGKFMMRLILIMGCDGAVRVMDGDCGDEEA